MVSSLPCGSAIMRASLRAWARSSGVCCARASRRSVSASSTARCARSWVVVVLCVTRIRLPLAASVRAVGDASAAEAVLDRGRAVLESRDELALNGIDAQSKSLQRRRAEHVQLARTTEQAEGVKGSSLDNLPLDRHDAPPFCRHNRQRAEHGGRPPGLSGAASTASTKNVPIPQTSWASLRRHRAPGQEYPRSDGELAAGVVGDGEA